MTTKDGMTMSEKSGTYRVFVNSLKRRNLYTSYVTPKVVGCHPLKRARVEVDQVVEKSDMQNNLCGISTLCDVP